MQLRPCLAVTETQDLKVSSRDPGDLLFTRFPARRANSRIEGVFSVLRNLRPSAALSDSGPKSTQSLLLATPPHY